MLHASHACLASHLGSTNIFLQLCSYVHLSPIHHFTFASSPSCHILSHFPLTRTAIRAWCMFFSFSHRNTIYFWRLCMFLGDLQGLIHSGWLIGWWLVERVVAGLLTECMLVGVVGFGCSQEHITSVVYELIQHMCFSIEFLSLFYHFSFFTQYVVCLMYQFIYFIGMNQCFSMSLVLLNL